MGSPTRTSAASVPVLVVALALTAASAALNAQRLMVIGLLAAACCGLACAQLDTDLVANGGFEEGTADALPGWESPSGREGVALVDDVRHSGGRSLRISAPGGVRSTLVPFSGGRVQVSGWLKTRELIRGPSRPWHKAALQLISYDGDRKSVGHRDIALMDGTHDWTRREATFLLSREVAFIAVFCQMWGGDTKGTVWFDDVSMRMLDDPATFARRPMDLDEATVTVDFDRPLGEFKHLWIGSDVGYMDRVTSATQVNAMAHAHKFGFRYLRMHDCVFNPKVYSEDDQGEPVYEWATFDKRVDTVVDAGMWPVIVLETMPREIAGRYSGKPWTNPYPPEDAEAYLKWQRLVHEIVAHCRGRWGEDIHNWYFEVWNEPDASHYFKGSLEDYLRVYDHAVAGAISADPLIRIGGPGGAGSKWVGPFLEHCRSGRNDATGLTGCRTDFVSWHIYTVGVGIPAFDALPLSLTAARKVLDDMPEYRDLPTLITEWGCSSSPHRVHDRTYDAAFRTMAVRIFMDHGIALALPFALGSGPPHTHEGFQGSLGMLTKTTIPKPSFRAFELLHRMTGTRISCGSSNDPVGGLACVAPDGNTAWVTLYNLVEQYTRDAYATAVTVNLAGLPEGDWRCAGTAIAPGECDPYVAWQDMGAPEELTQEQWDVLLEASELPAPVAVPLAGDTLQVAMPGFSVLQLELRRDRLTRGSGDMIDIELQTAHSGYDRKTCWVHARAGVIPGDPATMVMTMQKLRLTGSDIFYALAEMRSDDGGASWSEPVLHEDALGRRALGGGVEEGICDFRPAWHEATGVLLGTGHTVHYLDDDLTPHPRPRSTGYSTYDPDARTWAAWRKVQMPDEPKFFSSGAGSTQRVDLPDGDILLPIYFVLPDTGEGVFHAQHAATVMRCSFDGETLSYIEHGDEFTIDVERGFCEPSLTTFGGRYFLTLRNDQAGYVTSGDDGLHFDEPRQWTFDDGSELGNYNTQQHWLVMPDALYLVYTRRGADNDHVFRNRAPLFIAQVDPERLCVIRDTEVIAVPERGARLGNFGVTRISETESWVTVTEWMQTNPPDPYDCTVCERYGSDNSVFVAKVRVRSG